MEQTLFEEFLSACFVAALIIGPMIWAQLRYGKEDHSAWHIDDEDEFDSYEPVERRHPSLGNIPKNR